MHVYALYMLSFNKIEKKKKLNLKLKQKVMKTYKGEHWLPWSCRGVSSSLTRATSLDRRTSYSSRSADKC